MARGRAPGPLDNLPRPLSERERRRGPRLLRRLMAIGALGALAAAGLVGASSLVPPAMVPVGAVQGVVAQPLAHPSSAAQVPASPQSPGAYPAVAYDALASTSLRTREDGRGWPARPETLAGYEWPLPHGRITLPFGPSPWGSRLVEDRAFHDGVDMATFCGDRIVAAHDGIVLAAGRRFDAYMGWVGDLGPYTRRLDAKHLWGTLPIAIVIDDGNGYRSIYAHFWKVVVHSGQTVRAGQLIGYEGATGRATGCHLHYGLFSPQETALFAMEPAVMKRMKIPPYQIARVDPMRVLPPR